MANSLPAAALARRAVICDQIVAVLEGLGEEVITKKKEQFENFFRYGYRERGETIPGYIRRKEELYVRMRQIHATTQLSDDLCAYFMLGRCEARREGEAFYRADERQRLQVWRLREEPQGQ